MNKRYTMIIALFTAFGLMVTACGATGAEDGLTDTAVPESSSETVDSGEPEAEESISEEPVSLEPEKEPEQIHDVKVNLISEEAKQKAHGFPPVDGKLPDWKGVNVVDKAEFAWSWAWRVPDPEMVRDTSATVYTEAEAIEIAESGYDFVRLCLDSRFFFTDESMVDLEHVGEEFYGSIDTDNLTQYENLDQMIEWCIENNIHVCLDCHSTVGGLMIGGDEEASRKELFTPDSESQKIFLRFWDNIALRYADVDTKALSFNLYNEPPSFASENEEVYVNLMNNAIDEIQSYTADRLIFVDMMDYSRHGMKKIDELKANNLAASFHIYSEFATDTDIDSLDIDYAEKELASRLDEYNSYAEENRVRWMLQEYGCSVYINEADQEAYDGFIIDFCKENGVPYALWAYNGGDFGVATWADGYDKYLTPDAIYEETGQGHRINKALAELTSR